MIIGSSSASEQNRLLSQLLSIHPPSSNSKKKVFRPFDNVEDDGSVLVQVSDNVPAGRGLTFTRIVEPGQVLLTLHPDSLINVKSFRTFVHPEILPDAVGIASSTIPSSHRLSSSQLLSLLIARVKIEFELDQGRCVDDPTPKHDVLRLFVQTLPTSFDTVPLIWSLIADGIKDNGAGTSGEKAIADAKGKDEWQRRFFRSLLKALPRHSRTLQRKVRARFDKDWTQLCHMRDSNCDLLAEPALLATNPDLARRIVHSISLDTFLWAWLCVNSRCVFLPLGLADHADNFTLAPMLDMANHTPDPAFECKVRYAADGGLELCAPAKDQNARPDLGSTGFQPSDECFILYGPHSNEALLSEYGFVLPAALHFWQDWSVDPKFSKRHDKWKGNRYVDVLLDHEVEQLLRDQGASGEAKIELLQNRGYWGEFTLHPYPEPAHPSHRLIPALRLAALDPEDPASIPAADQPPKVAKIKTKPGVKAGKKAHAHAEIPEAGPSNFGKWEDTLMGFRDRVSDENEQHAHELLARLCSNRRRETETARQHLLEAKAILDATQGTASPGKSFSISYAFVKQLLDEEGAVLDLVSKAAYNQVDW